MQQIERVGVIALLLMVVTIITVAFWEDGGQDANSASGTAHAATRDAERGRPAVREPVGSESSGPEQRLRESRARDRERSTAPISVDGVHTPTPRPSPAGGPQDRPGASREGTGILASEGEPDRRGRTIRGNGGFEREQRRSNANRHTSLAEVERAAAGRDYPRPPTATRPTGSAEAPRTSGTAEARPGGYVTYTVVADDTLGEIALRLLGTSKRWKEIQALNNGIEPTKLHADMQLLLPADAAKTPGIVATVAPASKPLAPSRTDARPVEASAPAAGGKWTYVVQPNEILGRIAQRELGSARRWKEIAALNPKVDPDRIQAGMRLVMPAASGAAPAPARPRPLSARRDDGRVAKATVPQTPKYRVR